MLHSFCFEPSQTTGLGDIIRCKAEKTNLEKELCTLLTPSHKIHLPSAIRKVVDSYELGGFEKFNNSRQRDAGKFLSAILQILLEKRPDYNYMFGGKLESDKRCSSCSGRVNFIDEVHFPLAIDITGRPVFFFNLAMSQSPKGSDASIAAFQLELEVTAAQAGGFQAVVIGLPGYTMVSVGDKGEQQRIEQWERST